MTIKQGQRPVEGEAPWGFARGGGDASPYEAESEMNEIADKYKFLSLCFHDPQEEELRSEYARLFSLTVAGGIPPYETEYGHKDIFFKTQRLADIAGFYRAFGMEIVSGDRPDFIGAELEFMHLLLVDRWGLSGGEQDLSPDFSTASGLARAVRIDAAAKFMRDHLGRWGSYFGDQIAKSAHLPFYRRIGQWLREFIEFECERLGVEPERVVGWSPEPISTAEFECGLDDETDAPQPLTITR